MTHEWMTLRIAHDLGYSDLVCGRSASGPTLTIQQCQKCGTLRFDTQNGSKPLFAKLGCLLAFEPEVCER